MKKLLFLLTFLLFRAVPASAHTPHVCPPGFNYEPALAGHLDQAAVLKMSLPKIFDAGQQIFVTNFNICDGAGRPATRGNGAPRTADSIQAPR